MNKAWANMIRVSLTVRAAIFGEYPGASQWTSWGAHTTPINIPNSIRDMDRLKTMLAVSQASSSLSVLI